jgi:hypothetical protein
MMDYGATGRTSAEVNWEVCVSADSEFPGITDLEFPTLAEGSEVYG